MRQEELHLKSWRCQMLNRTRIKRHFTLIELLVVIAIISILASMLLPALSKAREKARKIECVNKMHSIGKAATMYTMDNDGNFFQSHNGITTWAGADPGETYFGGQYLLIKPAVQRGLRTPGNPIDCPSGRNGYLASSGYFWDYAYNARLGGVGANAKTFLICRVQSPSSKISFTECGDVYFVYGPTSDINYLVHNSQPNYLFIDVHVETKNRNLLADANFILLD